MLGNHCQQKCFLWDQGQVIASHRAALVTHHPLLLLSAQQVKVFQTGRALAGMIGYYVCSVYFME